MKKFKFVIIGIACIILICVGFYAFSQKNVTTEKELTEVEKLIVKDLESNYPKTPREVVKLYNKIVTCYYSGDIKSAEIEKLADQMLLIMDEDLLLVNPRDEYLNSVKADIRKYKAEKKKVVSTNVCDSNEVKYVDDQKEGTSEVNKIAYVDASYFINIDGKFAYSYQQFVLRKDDNGRWKILAFYETEGEPSDND
jgi:hypothetical protein